MLLKAKSLNLFTGRPVAIMNANTAKDMSISVSQRIRIKNSHEIIAIVDIAEGMISEDEIALSMEVIKALGIKENSEVDVSLAPPPKTNHYILEKMNGMELSYEKLYALSEDIVNNTLTEAEVAYFVSGVYINGMTDREIADLTKAMVAFGKRLDAKGNIYDKHCIGGIAGNRTTPLLVSICAEAGLIIPKTSSRAITSAAGTADVIETIANVEFSVDEIKKIIKKTNGCMVWGGALGLAPADDKIIQIERIISLDPDAQLIASILAKKLAIGAKGILIDIPYGKSAKVKTKEEARKLGDRFKKIAKLLNLNLRIVLTDGSQPIGNGFGSVLEARDIIRVLKQTDDRPIDLEKKALYLSSVLLEMSGKAGKGKGLKMAEQILKSGRAFKKFKEIIEAQGGRINGIENKLQPARISFPVRAEKDGKIREIDNKKISSIAKAAGCPSDKDAGVYLCYHVGDSIKKGDILMRIFSETEEKLNFAKELNHRLRPIVY